MNVPMPHYLLFSETSRTCDSGLWCFSLQTADGSEEFEAADEEPKIRGERLDLLTVVRALESLDQPSRVTLVGCSPYVRQGMQWGLREWRSNGWQWEFFGQMVPVKNGDLWQRLDRALVFHTVDRRHRRFDPPHSRRPVANGAGRKAAGKHSGEFGIRKRAGRGLRYGESRRSANGRRPLAATLRRWCRRLARSWRGRVSSVWQG